VHPVTGVPGEPDDDIIDELNGLHLRSGREVVRPAKAGRAARISPDQRFSKHHYVVV